MKKFKFSKLKPGLILFAISVVTTIILTLFKYKKGRFIISLSDSFFIMGTLYIVVAIVFEVLGWSSRKKHLRNSVNEKKIEEVKHSHKDAALISQMNEEENAQRKKEIYNLLWRMFVIVGFSDLGLSILIALIDK